MLRAVPIARSALVAHDVSVTARPHGHVRETVGVALYPAGLADQVRDGLRLDLDRSAALEQPLAVQEHVSELVRERLARLGTRDVGANRHRVAQVARASIRASELLTLDGEPGRLDLGYQALPQPLGTCTAENLSAHLEQVLSFGLRDVENVDDGEAAHVALRDLLAALLVDLGAFSTTWAEDSDSLLTFSDLPPEALPRAVSGDLRRVGTLRGDECDVEEAIAVKPGCHLEHPLSVLSARDRIHRRDELLLCLFEPRRAVGPCSECLCHGMYSPGTRCSAPTHWWQLSGENGRPFPRHPA